MLMVLALSATTYLFSCSDEINSMNESRVPADTPFAFTPQSALERFSEIISQATYESEELREFLKEEAIKRFDKNYDVLYAKVKNSIVGNDTFEHILEQYSSVEELSSIFHAVPELNILIPDISMFDVTAENMDCRDAETPVALPGKTYSRMYLNGVVVDSIKSGDVPAFHVFVINKNSRVKVNAETRSQVPTYEFIDQAFNGESMRQGTRSTNSTDTTSMNGIDKLLFAMGPKALASYNYFNKSDGSNESKALQRDYIYYGMKPWSTNGSLDRSIGEYITFIEINPLSYFFFADDISDNRITNDPYIENNNPSRTERDFTPEELIDAIWTEGAYEIKMEIVRSSSTTPLIKYIPVLPEDLWEFHCDRSYTHSTWFRHSKYSYSVNPENFTAKRVYLGDDLFQSGLSIGKWDLTEEALSRTIRFSEVDPSATVTSTTSYSVTKVNSNKVSGGLKFGLGIGNNSSFEIGGEGTSSTTTTETKTLTITRNEGDDDLGMEEIYFYDPIIEGKTDDNSSSSIFLDFDPLDTYIVKTYSTGFVTFGITAK